MASIRARFSYSRVSDSQANGTEEYSGVIEIPRLVPFLYGQTYNSSPDTIRSERGDAECAVGIPLSGGPISAGKAYLSP